MTDTRRVCRPGWNAAYRSPGISHLFLRSTSSTRGTLSLFLELPGGGHGEGWKTPFSAALCLCLRLYKSSGFLQLPGQVWAFKVISAMCTQECTLSDFPPGFSFSQLCRPRLGLPAGLAARDVLGQHQQGAGGIRRSFPGERGPRTTPQHRVQPLFFER